MFKPHPLLIALALLSTPPVPCVAQTASGGELSEIAEEIRLRVETYRSTGQIWVGETALAAPGLLAEMYEMAGVVIDTFKEQQKRARH